MLSNHMEPERSSAKGSRSALDQPGVVTAELASDDGDWRRPIWTVVLVCLIAIVISVLVSGVVLSVVAVADRGPRVLDDMDLLRSWAEDYGQTREGLLVLLLPTQIVFLLVACGAALLSPRPFASRLRLGGGVLPLWTWFVFIIATPIVGIVSSEVLSLFVTELSDNLKMIESVMRGHLGQSLPLLLVLVAVLPGVAEEVMFRGYLQTRLAERWTAVAAIIGSAVIFSAAHLDWTHGIGVLPLGIWLGAVAWRAESIWPAAVCHIVNNTFAVLGLKFQPEETIGVAMDPMTIGALIICGPAFLFSLYILHSDR
jgi:membrane protease YdiL (CAAX protease family)